MPFRRDADGDSEMVSSHSSQSSSSSPSVSDTEDFQYRQNHHRHHHNSYHLHSQSLHSSTPIAAAMTRMQAQPEAATKRNAGATRDIDPTIAAGTLSTAATSTETPPSRPLKRPGANLDLSPPASAPRAAPVGSGAATESGSDSGQDMDADYDPLPPSKDGRCHNYERNPQQVGAPTSKDLFPDFKQQKEGILASATAVSMKAALLDEPGYRWNNERAMEEAQRASKYVIDVDFSLSRFGDPYEDTEVWV